MEFGIFFFLEFIFNRFIYIFINIVIFSKRKLFFFFFKKVEVYCFEIWLIVYMDVYEIYGVLKYRMVFKLNVEIIYLYD